MILIMRYYIVEKLYINIIHVIFRLERKKANEHVKVQWEHCGLVIHK
jgi:hypothetical protein